MSRPRGRPRSFDESNALERAIQVFWSKGYDGVTIDDLVAGMGVGRPSLYAVFGDKRTVFLRALKAYAEMKGALAAQALLTPQTLRDALASFLKFGVEFATEEASAPGLSSPVHRAARRRCRGPAVLARCGGWRVGASGTPFSRRDHRGRDPV